MKALKFSSFVITATVLFTGFNMLEANAELNRTEAAMVASSNRNVLDLNQERRPTWRGNFECLNWI